MKNSGSRIWLIQLWVMAVLLSLGAIGALIVAIRNSHSLVSFVFFLAIMVICLLLGIGGLFYAVRRTRELASGSQEHDEL